MVFSLKIDCGCQHQNYIFWHLMSRAALQTAQPCGLQLDMGLMYSMKKHESGNMRPYDWLRDKASQALARWPLLIDANLKRILPRISDSMEVDFTRTVM